MFGVWMVWTHPVQWGRVSKGGRLNLYCSLIFFIWQSKERNPRSHIFWGLLQVSYREWIKKVNKLFESATLTSYTHDVWPLFSNYFSNSAPCSYPFNSVSPRTQLTPAPCCLVPSGAANTCPGYIPLHPWAAVGASLYPNGDPCSSPLQSGSGKSTLLCLGASEIGPGSRKKASLALCLSLKEESGKCTGFLCTLGLVPLQAYLPCFTPFPLL